jgi:WD40 repeat protein
MRVRVRAPAVALSNDGRVLAWSGFEARGVRLWDVDRARAIATLPGSDEAVRVVSFGDGGRVLAAGGEDGSVTLWDARSHRRLARLDPPGEVPIDVIAWRPHGHTLAAADADGVIRWWDIRHYTASGGPLRAGAAVTALAFSRDGRTLASASGRTVRLWDVASRRALGQPLRGQQGTIHSVAFAADGALRSTETHGSVVTWDPLLSSADPEAWRRRICRMVGRSLTKAEWTAVIPTEAYRPACRPPNVATR